MQQIESLGKEEFAESKSQLPIKIKNAQGSYLIDDSGRRYIDLTSGWCVGNLGWNLPEVERAIKTFTGPSYVSPHFEYGPWVELAHMLKEMTPGDLETSFRATGGTEAVEIALQAAIHYTGREIFVGIDDAYHGNSLATRGIVRSKSPYFDWRRMDPPLSSDSLDELESLLKDRKVAALVMEPIILNKGVLIPDKSFMNGVADLCHKYGSLLIIDEVATGFGRTGKIFGSDHFNLSPDILCLAKGLSGGAAGIGATIMKKEIGETLIKKDFPYSTYGWHPLSVAASIANLRYFRENWTELEENIRSVHEYLRQQLEEMNFRSKPEIRSIGMAFHLEFEDEDYGDKLSKKVREKGLILSGSSFFPPLNVELKVIQEALQIIRDCL